MRNYVPVSFSIVILAIVLLSACAPPLVETPTATPSLTATQTLTRTPRPTLTLTPTLLPTLPVEEAMERIAELEATNGGCEYPCFWGITPGVTSFQQARRILEPLSEQVDEAYYQEGVFEFYLLGDQDIADHEANITIEPSGAIVESIRYHNDLLLSDVLQLFGPPEEVYFYFSTPWIAEPGYWLVMDYSTIGVQVSFYDEYGAEYVTVDNYVHVQICGRYVGLGSTAFSFWATDYPPLETQDDVTFGNDKAVNIRDGLGMTPQEFYDLYADPNSTNCLIDPTPVLDLNDNGGG